MNVALRPLRSGDAAWIDTCLADALAGVSGIPSAAEPYERRVIERDGEPAGVVVVRVDERQRLATLVAVALPAAAARRGTGIRAAAMLEAELRGRGVTRIIAPAPSAHGIAVYFWIRLGYRPMPRAQWPCDTPGVAWFERAI